MEVIRTIDEIRKFIKEKRELGHSIGFVPTMGYLHEGHLALMREAKSHCDVVVVSIFVNPLQFGLGEDYEEYPRDLTRDAAMASSAGVDVIFAPSVAEMYPKGFKTFVEVEKLTEGLCGASRPGHFRGVATVVTKLFNIVQPDMAFFGQKDAQQVVVIRRMAMDLNMPVQIVTVPTVREKDGLAMSSRNVFLNEAERQAALVLSRSLRRAEELYRKGERSAAVLRQAMVEMIEQEPLARIDYVELVHTDTLERAESLDHPTLVALAVRIGKIRLIDNVILEG